MDRLVFQTHATVEFATNTFIDVPVILQYADTPLVELVRQAKTGKFMPSIPIFHPDGTYLAKAKGSRLFLTKEGKMAGLKMDYVQGVNACTLAGKTLFEIRRKGAAAVAIDAELFAPGGVFVRYREHPLSDFASLAARPLFFGKTLVFGSTFVNCKIGIHVLSDGRVAVGCNKVEPEKPRPNHGAQN